MSDCPIIGDANFDCLVVVVPATSLYCKGTVINKLVCNFTLKLCKYPFLAVIDKLCLNQLLNWLFQNDFAILFFLCILVSNLL